MGDDERSTRDRRETNKTNETNETNEINNVPQATINKSAPASAVSEPAANHKQPEIDILDAAK